MNLQHFFIFSSFLLVLNMCRPQKPQLDNQAKISPTNIESSSVIKEAKTTIATRFSSPIHFQRTKVGFNSFADFLRDLPLKEEGSLVTYYNGQTKPNNKVYDAVIDLPIGKRDLHQCADAIMRLRADYLFQSKKYDSIHFNFTNGFKASYSNWRKGKRIIVNGNDVAWKQMKQASDSPEEYWNYLEMVFSYAGTASLSKELKPVKLSNMNIGDVFIKGGFPGHAVIVVDMAVHQNTTEKVFLLAQSYMPAQELQILKNRNNTKISPWYSSSEIDTELRTPEWTFTKSQLKRFHNYN